MEHGRPVIKAYRTVRYQERFRFVNLFGSGHLKSIKEDGDILSSILTYLSDYDRHLILEGRLSVEVSFSKDWHNFEVCVVADDKGYSIEELNDLAQAVATAILKYEEDLHKQYQK